MSIRVKWRAMPPTPAEPKIPAMSAATRNMSAQENKFLGLKLGAGAPLLLGVSALRFFDPFAEIEQHRNFLPHWQQPGATYFITFRLADSIPAELRGQWQAERAAWLAQHREPWTPEIEREYHVRFSQQIDAWLDVGYGACWLRTPAIRSFVAATLHHRDRDRYALHAWVTMPNHAHVLVRCTPTRGLKTKWALGKACPRARSIGSLADEARSGRRITSTGWYATRGTSRTACATSGATRKRRGCVSGSMSCGRVS